MAKNDITVEELQKQLETAKEENSSLKKALESAETVAAEAQAEAATLKAALERSAPAAKMATVNTKTKKNLNIRSGPSKTNDILVTLPCDTTVEILQLPGNVVVPDWVLIQAGDYIGWAMAEFLKVEE